MNRIAIALAGTAAVAGVLRLPPLQRSRWFVGSVQ